MSSPEKHWSIPAGIAAAAGFLTGCLIPFGTYIGNSQEFPHISCGMMFSICLGAFVVATLIFWGIFLLLQRFAAKAAPAVMIMISALAVAVYGQGNIFGARYQILDGRAVPWEKMIGTGVLNSAIWLLIIGVGVFAAVKWKERALVIVRNVMLAFAGFMMLVTVMRFLTVQTVPQTTAAFNNRDFYGTSSRRNIFVFVVDSFDILLFDQLVKERPETVKILKGFTSYGNTIGKFPTTVGALPHIMTGIPNDNKKKYADYLDYAFTNSPFIKAAQQKDFDLYFYTYQSFAPRYELLSSLSHIKNTEEVKFDFFKDNLSSYKVIYRSSVFTYLPHFLKKYTPRMVSTYLSKPHWTFSDNVTNWLSAVPKSEKLSITTDRKVCKVFHLAGVHLPHYTTETAEANIGIVSNFIAELKRLGVYEKSSVIITADHGTIDAMRPIFICNDGKGELIRSDQPFSFDDLDSYLIKLLDRKDIQVPVSKGTREFWSYELPQASSQLYLPPITKVKFDPAGQRIVGKDMYKSVYNGEDLSKLSAENFSLEIPRSAGRWAGKGTASIKLPLRTEFRNKEIYLSISTVLPMENAEQKQELTFWVNKTKLEVRSFTKAWTPQTITLKVPAQLNTGDFLDLSIEGKNAFKLSASDPRQLSFLLKECSLSMDASGR